MDKLLIIADDFTGALDTGIQFTKMGIRAKIVTDYQYDFQNLKEEYQLLVVNTDSRPLSSEEAYNRVYHLAVNARKAGFEYVYKKTDSGLRGNIGAEIKAVMDAYEEDTAYCIPALPSLNRITRKGVQYIDGIPVQESVFGKDPFEPVCKSDVADVIHIQNDISVEKVPTFSYEQVVWERKEPTVFLFDAETDHDMYRIAGRLKEHTNYHVCAGCAGFAAAYEVLLDFERGNPHYMQLSDRLLVLCGSVNEITVKQLVYARKHGFGAGRLQNGQKLDPAYRESEAGKEFLDQIYKEICLSERFLIDTLDETGKESAREYAARRNLNSSQVRFGIADTLGWIAAGMIERGWNGTLCMTGGDTLMGFMRLTGVTELVPVCEIGKGAVLSAMWWHNQRIQVISKSGGFGEEDIFEKMYDMVSDQDSIYLKHTFMRNKETIMNRGNIRNEKMDGLF
ncbi:four-carbon acid sugar kinase family protein [Clostridium sp. AF32-12BH]|uniref:four-carbon acid sugar kinase family protein n=1 Tax=Clostridium sp. AF32-12BH TaxID=2292006 RepID=UPI000E51F912|nr:four-carbon acid sugar kinase family protein [Clostridium sp. AF32-12BH]RHP44997.1 four-carbon acid sugar kinase family protein [Clostridium sp. AF32-12BH]